MDKVGLSEVRRPGSREISSRGYTYNWSGRGHGAHLGGLTLGVFGRLQLSVTGVTPADERIILVTLKHTLAFICLIDVYDPTEMSVLEEEVMFYTKLDSIVDQCPSRDTLIVLVNFSAVTVTVSWL